MAELDRLQKVYEEAVWQFINHQEEKVLYSVSQLSREMVRQRLSPDLLLDVHAATVRALLDSRTPREMGKIAVVANEVLANAMMTYAMSYHSLVNALEVRETELEEANRKLKEVDGLKSLFIATVSHELRAPLNSIIGFANVLINGVAGEINPEQERQLGILKANADHLLELINDIIDISKIEAGRVEVSPASFELGALIREVADSFAIAFEKKGLPLVCRIPGAIPVVSDVGRIRQVLTNLLHNAVKFTERGTVEIVAGEAAGRISVAVRDTGIGIDKDDQHRLFTPFTQVGTEGGPHEGTGLGLYLCRRICALLGGELKVESEPGRGSTFTVLLPAVLAGGGGGGGGTGSGKRGGES